MRAELEVPEELIELIAARAAQLTRQLELEENPPSPYMTVDEAAEFLDIEGRTISSLVRGDTK